MYIYSDVANHCACITTLLNDHCAQCSYVRSYFAKRQLLLNVVVLLRGSWRREADGLAGLESPGIGQGHVVGCCEQGTEPLGSIRSTSRRIQLFGETYTKVVTSLLFK